MMLCASRISTREDLFKALLGRPMAGFKYCSFSVRMTAREATRHAGGVEPSAEAALFTVPYNT
jgi:hypothetical protein